MAGISKVGKKGLQDGALTTTAASAPTVGAKGELFYNTAENKLYVSNGTIWTRVSNDAPSSTGGTVVISTLNEGATFSYNLGTNFTDDSNTDAELTYSLESGTLPGGAALPTSGNSAMTGTVGNVSSNTVYTFSIRATDSAGATAIQDYQQQINTVAATVTGGTVTISSVQEGLSASYDVDANFTFGAGKVFSAYSLLSGTLPSGLSLNTSTGVISGTMGGVSSTTAYSFTIRGTDTDGDTADQAYSWAITNVPLGSVSTKPATSAHAIITAGDSQGDGLYWIQSSGGVLQQFYCIMNTSWDGGGWLIIANHVGGHTQSWNGHQPRPTSYTSYVGHNTAGSNGTPTSHFSMNAKNVLFTEAIHVAYDATFTNYMAYYQMEFSSGSIPTTSTYQLNTTGGGNVITGLQDRRLSDNAGNHVHNTYRPDHFGVNNACGSTLSGVVYPVYTAAWGSGACSGANTFSFSDSSGSTGWDDFQDGSGMGDDWNVNNVGANAYRNFSSFIAIR
jgi:hypothetical protein